MQALRTKRGFPNSHQGSTVCPFCGGDSGDIEDVSSGHFQKAVSVTIGFRCMTGCYWELRLGSDRGDLEAAECALVNLDTELLEETQRDGLPDWVYAQAPFTGDK